MLHRVQIGLPSLSANRIATYSANASSSDRRVMRLTLSARACFERRKCCDFASVARVAAEEECRFYRLVNKPYYELALRGFVGKSMVNCARFMRWNHDCRSGMPNHLPFFSIITA